MDRKKIPTILAAVCALALAAFGVVNAIRHQGIATPPETVEVAPSGIVIITPTDVDTLTASNTADQLLTPTDIDKLADPEGALPLEGELSDEQMTAATAAAISAAWAATDGVAPSDRLHASYYTWFEPLLMPEVPFTNLQELHPRQPVVAEFVETKTETAEEEGAQESVFAVFRVHLHYEGLTVDQEPTSGGITWLITLCQTDEGWIGCQGEYEGVF